LYINGLGADFHMFIAACHLRDGNGAMGVPRPNRVDRPLGKNPREGGFTLIEIMIVVAIIGVVSAIAVPSYVQWNARYQLRQATSELQTNLLLARMSARNRNTPVTATFIKAADGTYSYNFGGGLAPTDLPRSVTGGSMILVTGLGPPPATIVTDFASSGSGTLGTIMFSQQGVRIAGGVGTQTVTLQSAQGVTYSVAVAPSGKVNWCAMASCP
jgi:prepilin-type N-terminal cleavage/methylation domain-containing protein